MIAEICSEGNCFGCALCESLCPKGAIKIEIREGFYRPTILESCVSCGRCINCCPANNEKQGQKNNIPEKAYAAWCKDRSIHHLSSSGGLAYRLAYEFICNGGSVAGVWFNPRQQIVEHRLFDNTNDLLYMRGSRYVNSSKTGIYKEVAEKIKEKNVLFIGVPCEVFAIKQFISRIQHDHQLFCIDLLCHGGASPRCLQDHITAISRGRQVGDVSFRGGKYDCSFTVWGSDRKKMYSVGQFTDPYFLMFMKRVIYQKACYNCAYAGSERVGDITLGDFWGLDKEIEKQTDIRGINLLFINTAAGEKLIETVKSDIMLMSRPIEEAISGNDTLRAPTQKPREYEELWKLINQDGFHKAIKTVYGINWRRNVLISYLKKTKSKAVNIMKEVIRGLEK